MSWKFISTLLFDSLYLIYFSLNICTLIFPNSCLYDCLFIISYSFFYKSLPLRSLWLISFPLLKLLPSPCSPTFSTLSYPHCSYILSTPFHSNSLPSTSSPLLTLDSPPFISITQSLFLPFFFSLLFSKGPCISSRCRCRRWRSLSLRQSYGCYSRKGTYVRTHTFMFDFYRI